MRRYEALHLANTLMPTRNLKCTDPRDKLFALIGLSSPGWQLVAHYSKSTWDTYVSFTEQYITRAGDLSLLLAAGLPGDGNGLDLGLPSWCPDFRGSHGVDVRYLAASYLEYYNSSRDMSFPVNFRQTPDGRRAILQTKGVVFDAIADIFPLEKGEESRRNILQTLIPARSEGPPQHQELYALFKAMILDDPTLHRDEQGSETERRREHLTRLLVGYARDVQLLEGVARDELFNIEEFLRDVGEEWFQSSGMLPSWKSKSASFGGETVYWLRQEYLVRCGPVSGLSSSSIFSTQRGYIGRGLRQARSGDVLAIVAGCRLPLILRRDGAYLQLVSPCYVSGVMDGELVDKLENAEEGLKVDVLQLV